ncbi:MAG TPA: hypothetical protein VJU02_00885 [Nitrospiraceae bacterium]|nr:hypothetical protein [Nitrospiraceae bacterium]
MMVSPPVPTIAFIIGMTMFAQLAPGVLASPPSSSGKDGQDNKGGQLRGLDRADQAAGQHGMASRVGIRHAMHSSTGKSILIVPARQSR